MNCKQSGNMDVSLWIIEGCSGSILELKSVQGRPYFILQEKVTQKWTHCHYLLTNDIPNHSKFFELQFIVTTACQTPNIIKNKTNRQKHHKSNEYDSFYSEQWIMTTDSQALKKNPPPKNMQGPFQIPPTLSLSILLLSLLYCPIKIKEKTEK